MAFGMFPLWNLTPLPQSILEIHVYLIPNFFAENKIVGKQKKNLAKLKVLQLYSSILVIRLHTNKCLLLG
jgi:hypothetical protein